MNLISEFTDAITSAGIVPPPEILADGALHRFSADGRPGDTAGYYILHPDGIPAGCFGDWRQDISANWRADIGRALTEEEQREQRTRAAAMRAARRKEESEGHELAATQAESHWSSALPATADHPYLRRKGIQPHGARVRRGDGWLLVPMTDLDGKLWNLEQIAPAKPAQGPDKKGFFRGRRTGLCYLLGAPTTRILLVAEGFATSASLHQATGHAVACAFNAGNLGGVTKAIRERYPEHLIILCADDDHETAGNPGLTKAKAAAKATGALVAIPDFGANRPADATDFNDLHLAQGLKEVKRQIEAVIKLAEHPAPAPAPEQVPKQERAPGSDPGPDFPPSLEIRPCYRVLDDWLETGKGKGSLKYRPGVYYCGVTEGSEKSPSVAFNTWICSPLHLDATTHDDLENNFGRLLRFKNSLGKWRTWAMPMELLRGSGEELRGELLAMGVHIDPKYRNYLATYLQHEVPKHRMRCALRTGWLGSSFVLPDEVIGPQASNVIYQSGDRGTDEFTRAGSLAGWRDQIAAKATGNPLLMQAISTAFAGPLLDRVHSDGGGVHFVWDSSTGKTTLIRAGCSVWGGDGYLRTWRATANGLEGAATLFNDGLLALDEISECDPREIGAIVYSLANGRGKQRANRTGAARGVSRWRCVILSSGERTMATAMEEGNRRVKAGQEVRLLSLPASRTYGCWDNLHGFSTGAALSDHLKTAVKHHHGHAGRAFLERLTRDQSPMGEYLAKIAADTRFSPADADGQEKRAATRFAVIALAGELASRYGITGWASGDAIMAAGDCFAAWRAFRGQGNDETRQISEQISAFLDRHGDSRFSSADLSHEQIVVRDRAGWWKEGGEEGRLYYFTADAMREALRGHDLKRGLAMLEGLGVLVAAGNGDKAKAVRIGSRVIRAYLINPANLAGGRHVA